MCEERCNRREEQAVYLRWSPPPGASIAEGCRGGRLELASRDLRNPESLAPLLVGGGDNTPLGGEPVGRGERVRERETERERERERGRGREREREREGEGAEGGGERERERKRERDESRAGKVAIVYHTRI